MSVDGALRTALDRFAAWLTSLYGVVVSWGYAVANGEVTGAASLAVTGLDANTDTVTGLPVWPPSVAYTWQVADQQPRLASSLAADTLLGNGARVVRVWWLDSANVEHVEDVNMNGVGQVLLAGLTARRINRMEVVSAGPIGWNEGIITCYATDGATVMCYMTANRGVSDSAIQTVPAGKVDSIERFIASGTGGLVYWAIAYRESPTTPWKRLGRRFVNTGSLEAVFDAPIRFAAGTDYYVWGFAGGGAYISNVALLGWRENA